MRENAVAEDAVAERPVHGLSKAMAVVALYALFPAAFIAFLRANNHSLNHKRVKNAFLFA